MRRTLALFTLALLTPCFAFAQRMRPDSALLTALRWRSIGPANMAGRVSDIEANPRNPKVFYVAYATGGVWKTVNAGTTWQPIFDNTGAHSVSELAIAPSDTNTVWAGTGEEDSRNSISPGSGVFKSTDGGRTWTNMGLRESHHIGRILVH
ncbi:MAG: glycosyl hydrolase, partial [Gemmatimonadetes bacterium]|nr:glycosyl hydrolase [Gemmatimonadota bacterium]